MFVWKSREWATTCINHLLPSNSNKWLLHPFLACFKIIWTSLEEEEEEEQQQQQQQ